MRDLLQCFTCFISTLSLFSILSNKDSFKSRAPCSQDLYSSFFPLNPIFHYTTQFSSQFATASPDLRLNFRHDNLPQLLPISDSSPAHLSCAKVFTQMCRLNRTHHWESWRTECADHLIEVAFHYVYMTRFLQWGQRLPFKLD